MLVWQWGLQLHDCILLHTCLPAGMVVQRAVQRAVQLTTGPALLSYTTCSKPHRPFSGPLCCLSRAAKPQAVPNARALVAHQPLGAAIPVCVTAPAPSTKQGPVPPFLTRPWFHSHPTPLPPAPPYSAVFDRVPSTPCA